MKEENKNPWTAEDEREHFPSEMEWWCAEAFFRSVEDNKKWSLKGSFTEWFTTSQRTGSILNITLLNQDDNKHYIHYSRDDSAKLESAKDDFHVEYSDSFMKGSYPNYEMRFNDPKNNIELYIKYHAESLPHWITQDVTDGWLPMGLGFYRYGFIPKCDLSGTMKIKDKAYTLEGLGYFEHVWGNFSYRSPLATVKGLKKTIATYARLIGWWLHNHKIRIPKSIMFSTENNPLGYDWVWALLDNGWTIFYGNLLFWIMKGPMTGSLIFSKDGRTYTEFCNVHFQYNKTRYAKEYDFYYPSELEVTAKRRKEKLHLRFNMTAESREYISRFSDGKYWLGLVICEAPGTVEGYYFNGEKKIELTGICKIEPQRQISVIGHNSLKLDFLLPPKGVGIDVDLNSHYLKKRVTTRMHFAPHLDFKFNIKKLKDEDFSSFK